jgi:ssDNA-binding Zn-finger/Zn-ribbon topoisomerase 1
MSGFYDWKCNHCDNIVEVKPNIGFFRDAEGTLKLWGQTVPVSLEAEEFGVKGFYGNYYCPTCRELQKVIEVEFKTPNDFNERITDIGEDLPFCDVCGTSLAIEPNETIICPKCNKGTFSYARAV